jgi:hypothetical protein
MTKKTFDVIHGLTKIIGGVLVLSLLAPYLLSLYYTGWSLLAYALGAALVLRGVHLCLRERV